MTYIDDVMREFDEKFAEFKDSVGLYASKEQVKSFLRQKLEEQEKRLMLG